MVRGGPAKPKQRPGIIGAHGKSYLCFASASAVCRWCSRVGSVSFAKSAGATLRLRLFLVFSDVLHVIADHLLHELIIELVAGKLAKPVVHNFLSRIRLWGDRHADLQW